jgi:hypothetical protein
MISIIISSANPSMLEDISENIKSTIGVPYELLSYSNSNGEKGICEIYNKGAQKAKYDVLCYMHEDLDLKTQNWGEVVLDKFKKDSEIGVLGVVGGLYKSYAPSGWAAVSVKSELVACNYLQSFKRSNQPSIHYESNTDNVDLAPVISIDGMWFCTLKKIALQHPFDQDLLKGFHCYDLDFCLNVQQHYKIMVTFDILMEHFSEGGYNHQWFEDTLKLHEKWDHTLPRSIHPLETKEQSLIEKRSYKWILEKLVLMNYPITYIISLLYRYKMKGGLASKQFFKLVYYTLKFLKEKRFAG